MKIFRKITAVLLVMSLFVGIAGISSATAAVDRRYGNENFGTKAAQLVIEYDEKAENDAARENTDAPLRLIGKTVSYGFDLSSYGACEYIRCTDNRFVMQFDDVYLLEAAYAALDSDSGIVYVNRDRYVNSLAVETVINSLASWGTKAIGADLYSQYVGREISDGDEVVVAVIDSGVADIDFLDGRVVGGYDFVDNDYDASNDINVKSHGTHMSSIIVDTAKNLPVYIMPVKVIGETDGALIDVINGIYFAVDNGADVINISLGYGLDDCEAFHDALAYAYANGVTCCVSAGNDGVDCSDYCPAHVESAITVSAVDSINLFGAGYSNYGACVDIAMPGVLISGYNAQGQKITGSGTSMAAAFASAASALIKLANPDFTTDDIRQSLVDCAKDLGAKGYDVYYGYGLPQLSALMPKVEGISLDVSEVHLTVGESFTPAVTFIPANAGNQNIIWIPGKNDVVQVDSDGTITAVSAGEMTMLARTVEGGFIARYYITVTGENPVALVLDDEFYDEPTTESTTKQKQQPKPQLTKVDSAAKNVKISLSKTKLAYGETAKIKITGLPAGYYVRCVSSDSKVAVINSKGLVESVGMGNSVIKATIVDRDGYVCADEDGDPIVAKVTVRCTLTFGQLLRQIFSGLFNIRLK